MCVFKKKRTTSFCLLFVDVAFFVVVFFFQKDFFLPFFSFFNRLFSDLTIVFFKLLIS